VKEGLKGFQKIWRILENNSFSISTSWSPLKLKAPNLLLPTYKSLSICSDNSRLGYEKNQFSLAGMGWATV